jgi:amino acid adenylation domain-containing protein/non-ribosomal peptide synthase protein (TIGR01720 family)
MTTLELLSKLRSKDIQIWADGDRLRCNAPKGGLTPDLRKELAAHKSAILALLRKADGVTSSAALPLKPVERSRDLPLSFAQQRLWFLNQLGTGSAYNIPLAIRLSGLPNIKALEDSLNEIIRRHEALRTTFRASGGRPVQVIAEKISLEMPLIDLSGQPKAERELAAKRLASNEAMRRFDFVKGPLFNAALIRLSEDEHILLLTMHHIITDGWSMSVFTAELATLYKAYCIGEASPLAALPIQYADFAHWQREWLQGEILENQVSYWRKQLEGVPVLQLLTDRPRPSVQTYEGARRNIALSPTLTAALHDLCRRQGVTLFMTMLAAFQTLLFRYTGQEDIVVGSPIANRNRTEIEGLIGFFVNSLAMRTDLSGNPTFSELIRRVQGVALGAYEHQDLPFEKLVERLNPERDMSHNPLFQIMFAIQSLSVEELQLPGLTLSPFSIERVTASFDIELHLWEKPEGLSGMVVYNIDLFDDATIARLVGHYETLLESIVADPDQRISDVQILSDTERKQVLVGWNDTSNYYPNDKCIHHLFEEQVESTPDAVAVVFKNQQLTYQQLNQRANQLAHHLLSLGVGPEVPVGICVERSLEMLVGLLAILKAGGAYVPLDPNYPHERLSYLLSDSGIGVLVTNHQLFASVASPNVQKVYMDREWGAIEQHSQDNLEVRLGSDNLAYVIYTSGSTGFPKGVLVEHRNVVRLFTATQSWYEFNANDVWTNHHSIAFDFSVWEIWGALLYGGRLVIVPYWSSRDPQRFYDLLCKEKVTVLNQTPSAFRQLMEIEKSDGRQAELYLRLVIFGGETLEPKSLKPWFEKYGDQSPQLVNMYGITETTVHVTYRPLTSKDVNSSRSAIGRPIPDLQMYILDDNFQPAPIGVKGEMFVGGAGVARGYLNRHQLSKERFIANPFSDQGEGRLYKTGDLARYLPNGEIEYLGRKDNQVKIRGFRIELGEIESALNTHPQVQQAVVIAREDIPGNKQLVAYVVSSSDAVSTNELRELIKSKLPEYMVPSAFIPLDILPLTANGKVDRQALPAPDGETKREDGYLEPRTEIEQTLAKIWQELLLKEQIGIDENFFEIGGDSILSIQVVSRAKNSGIQITAKQIFQNQTIADLATVANTTVNVRAQQGVVTGVAPLTPIQRWFWAQNRKAPHHYNQSFVLEISDRLQPELLEKAVAILLEHHDALRIRFTSGGSVTQQMNQGLDESVPFTVVDLSSTSKRSQTQALAKIAKDYQGSLNLYTGPLMQVVLFNLGRESGARLLMIIHHLVVDGVSWRILLSDLKTIYEQLATQRPIQLSAKTTSFIDWAGKLYNYAQSEIGQQELAYWLSQSWAKTTPLPVDYDRARSENTLESRSRVSMRLTVEETRALLGPANEAYNTQVNDLLLSALTVSLAEWTGNSAVLIDLEGHGREELFEGVDLTRTVGWFTSMFPIVLELPRDNQSASRIKSIKEQLRGIPNRGLGYGILRYLCEDSTVKDQIVKTPKAQIVFNFLGQFDQIQTQTGWKFTSQSRGSNQNVQQTRDHLLEVNSWVVEGQLQIDWGYSRNFHSKETVKKIAQRYSQAVKSIIEHCQGEDSFGYTPSDFPDALLSQSELDELLEVEIREGLDSIGKL